MLQREGRKAIDVANRGSWETRMASPSSVLSRGVPRLASSASSNFCLILDPPAAGPWNMAVDEALLEAADQGQCTLRLYQWEQPTLSLGYFQPYEERWTHEPSRGCVAVRRSSGGGAILHDNEITYSLAVNAEHPLAADRLGTYRAVHAALIDALTQWGIHASLCGNESDTLPNGAAKAKEPFLCFQRRAPGDVLLNGFKIAGSAQRRCRGAVLQHGSVLLGRSLAAPELPGIHELTGIRLEPQPLIEAWLERLWGPAFNPVRGVLASQQNTRAMGLVHTKYGGNAWTEHRDRLA